MTDRHERDEFDADDEKSFGPPEFRLFDKEEARIFRDIDREAEDRLVVRFCKTRKVDLLEQLLKLREQTIRHMAKKYAYLDNEDDMYCEFKGIWLKCVKRYDPSIRITPMRTKSGKIILDEKGKPKMMARKTPFNTYLYTSMKHRAMNIIKHRNHTQKSQDDNGDPVADSMRSLDYEYGEDGDSTLKDVIPDSKIQSTFGNVQMGEMIRNLGGHNDPDISRAVSNFISNPHFGTLTAACNFRAGTLKVAQWDREVLALGMPIYGEPGKPPKLPKPEAKAAADEHLKKMVSSTGAYHPKFEVVDYVLQGGSVNFVIREDNNRVLRKVKEAVAKCRELMVDDCPEGENTTQDV